MIKYEEIERKSEDERKLEGMGGRLIPFLNKR